MISLDALTTSSANLPLLFVDTIQQTRSQLDSDIARQFLSGKKFGLPGSNGRLLSNFSIHFKNNNKLAACFLADKRNPFSKEKRRICLFATLSLSLFLSSILCAFSTTKNIQTNEGLLLDATDPFLGNSILVALFLVPTESLLEALARCSLSQNTDRTCIISCCNLISSLFMYLIVLLSVIYILATTLIVMYVLNDGTSFLFVFFIGSIFNLISDALLGLIPWVVVSWQGCLFIPQISCCTCTCSSRGDNDQSSENGEKKNLFPPRFFPIWGIFPFNFLLMMMGLGESTYVEDKESFEREYGENRIAIDRERNVSMDVNNSMRYA